MHRAARIRTHRNVGDPACTCWRLQRHPATMCADPMGAAVTSDHIGVGFPHPAPTWSGLSRVHPHVARGTPRYNHSAFNGHCRSDSPRARAQTAEAVASSFGDEYNAASVGVVNTALLIASNGPWDLVGIWEHSGLMAQSRILQLGQDHVEFEAPRGDRGEGEHTR